MHHAKEIALGGIMAALSLVVLMVGSLIGIWIYAAPLLAALLLVPIGTMANPRLHTALWIVVSVLAFILVPDTDAALLFFCPIGCYPLLRPYVQRLPGWLRLPAMLAFFLLTVLPAQWLLTLLVLPQAIPPSLSLVLLAAGCVLFALYDRLIPLTQHFAVQRLKQLFRMQLTSCRQIHYNILTA